jgi:hypothetical protein
MLLLAFIRTYRMSRILTIQVGLVSANYAPSEFPSRYSMLILDINLDLFLDLGAFLFTNLKWD